MKFEPPEPVETSLRTVVLITILTLCITGIVSYLLVSTGRIEFFWLHQLGITSDLLTGIATVTFIIFFALFVWTVLWTLHYMVFSSSKIGKEIMKKYLGRNLVEWFIWFCIVLLIANAVFQSVLPLWFIILPGLCTVLLIFYGHKQFPELITRRRGAL